VARGKQDPKKSRWERTKLAAGTASAVVGLVVALAGVPGKIGDAFGRSDSKQADLALKQKRTEVAEAAPRLDISYLFLSSDLVGATDPETVKKHRATAQAVTILSFPTIDNAILNQTDGPTAGCRLRGPYGETSIAFLVVQNRGRRDATNVTVAAKRLELRGVVRVDDDDPAQADYVARLRANARGSVPTTVRIPETLGPGEGVRVPIWATSADPGQASRWCVVSKTALEPATVSFTDPVLGSVATIPVRRLASPVLLGDGIEGRG